MKQEFSFDGQVYSEYKATFKRILKKHGLEWKGSMGDFVWIGEHDKVMAEFDRDTERDITISAKLIWSGKKKTDFLRELEDWSTDVGGKKEKVSKKKVPDKKVQKELEFWDTLHKPDEKRLRSEGRPESWIQKDLRLWKKMRREKKKELREKYT